MPCHSMVASVAASRERCRDAPSQSRGASSSRVQAPPLRIPLRISLFAILVHRVAGWGFPEAASAAARAGTSGEARADEGFANNASRI